MKRKTVLAVTGIRSEYFLARPIFQAIQEHGELSLSLVVTGAHLSPLHGNMLQTIERDGFPIAARLESLLFSDRPVGRLKGALLQWGGLAQVVDGLKPDWLLAVADREEPLGVALCGSYLGIPVAHYSAGDRVMYNVDDMVRHAISRLSHLLLTTHEEARQRLIKAGEQAWRVHNVGHAGLDRFRKTPALGREEIARIIGGDDLARPYVVVLQHPLSSEAEQAGPQMRETLEAVRRLGWPSVVIYPNSDPGSHDIIKTIDEYRNLPGFHVFPTLDDTTFVNVLKQAGMLIGNSSLGLLEAPYLKLPVINVGRRQTMRYHAENVFFVEPDQEQIMQQARRIVEDETIRRQVAACTNPFGDGHAGERVARLLAETPYDARLFNKDLEY